MGALVEWRRPRQRQLSLHQTCPGSNSIISGEFQIGRGCFTAGGRTINIITYYYYYCYLLLLLLLIITIMINYYYYYY